MKKHMTKYEAWKEIQLAIAEWKAEERTAAELEIKILAILAFMK